jgi:D-sedoheptulose 7-phosphate isomerase
MATVMQQLSDAQKTFSASVSIVPALEKAADTTLNALKAGRSVFSCGNGGSSADALHLTEELTGRFRKERRPLPGICLCADVAAMTCIANDYGYEQVFARQLRALAREGDVLFAFSTSGNSPNVLAALEVARVIGVISVLVTGASGGRGAAMADQVLAVPSDDTARIQEVHTFILHAVLETVESHFIAQ